jgi:hypothetical protein
MTTLRTALAASAWLALSLAAPLAAQARDVCLQDNSGNTWVFQKVKKFKPTRTVALTGIYIAAGETFPVQGVGVLRPSGNLEVGVFVHDMSGAIFTENNFAASMQTTPGLEGTGGIDNDGDHQVDLANFAWSAVECDTVTVP